MPVAPSELPWWGWLISAVAFGIVALMTYRFARNLKAAGEESWIFLVATFLLCLGMLGLGFMGLLRFLK